MSFLSRCCGYFVRSTFFLCAIGCVGFAASPVTANGDAVRGAAKVAACASCHGTPDRPPLPGMPSLAGQQPAFLVVQMFFMREGLRAVPAMDGLLKGLPTVISKTSPRTTLRRSRCRTRASAMRRCTPSAQVCRRAWAAGIAISRITAASGTSRGSPASVKTISRSHCKRTATTSVPALIPA